MDYFFRYVKITDTQISSRKTFIVKVTDKEFDRMKTARFDIFEGIVTQSNMPEYPAGQKFYDLTNPFFDLSLGRTPCFILVDRSIC